MTWRGALGVAVLALLVGNVPVLAAAPHGGHGSTARAQGVLAPVVRHPAAAPAHPLAAPATAAPRSGAIAGVDLVRPVFRASVGGARTVTGGINGTAVRRRP
jgi:hypothetical protein